MAFSGPEKGRHHEVEKDVADCILQQREGRMPVTMKRTQAKAREIANIRGVTQAQFKAKRGCVTRFMKRFWVQPVAADVCVTKLLGQVLSHRHPCVTDIPLTSRRS